MNQPNSILNTLIDVNDCVLILIDIQDAFLNKCTQEMAVQIIHRAGWLLENAKILSVPIVVTAEDIEYSGSLTGLLAAHLPADTPVYNKMFFNLADNPEILKAVAETGRNTAILMGLETDVCIAQSAIGLLQNGYKVAVVEDASASPGEAQRVGLERLKNAGILITSTKALYYEWVRGVEKSIAMSRNCSNVFPNPPL